MKYSVVIEKGPTSFGACVPDLPGCIAAAETLDEVMELIREAIPFHLDGLRRNGDPIPDPDTLVEYVDAPLNSAS